MSSRQRRGQLRLYQLIVLAVSFLLWYALTSPTLLPPIYFDNANKAAFFFGEPQKVLARIWDWFSSGSIYEHLGVTLVETMLAFVIGTVFGRGHRPVARAEPDGLGVVRSLHQGGQFDAARDPGADLRDLVRPRHRLRRWRWA